MIWRRKGQRTMRNLMRILACLLTAHEANLVGRGRELFLKCERCGLRSPGITLDDPPVMVRADRPVTHPVTIPWHVYGVRQPVGEGQHGLVPVDYLGTLDEATGNLVADLDLAGREADLQLLLLPPVNDLKH